MHHERQRKPSNEGLNLAGLMIRNLVVLRYTCHDHAPWSVAALHLSVLLKKKPKTFTFSVIKWLVAVMRALVSARTFQQDACASSSFAVEVQASRSKASHHQELI
jgi:hypothetical protein